ncbi:MAG TPA: hypothetical protein VH062_26455 [Polyangiaceae bacterium]|jgi:hypothetical protein|nr:hypothetical protein [Polyangiaceae bacterium]
MNKTSFVARVPLRRVAPALALCWLTACSSTSRPPVVAPHDAVESARWVGPEHVPLVLEHDEAARDLAALNAVVAFWGLRANPVDGAVLPGSDTTNRDTLLAGDLERSARAAGLTAFAFHGTLDDVVFELRAGRPVIVGVSGGGATGDRPHFEVVVACDPDARRLRNLDPARGIVERTYSSFEDDWEAARQLTLVLFASDGTAMTPPLPSTAEATRSAASRSLVARAPL